MGGKLDAISEGLITCMGKDYIPFNYAVYKINGRQT